MKKRISIPQVDDFSHLDNFARAQVDVINWADYPYKPKTTFAMAYTAEALLIRFEVDEPYVVGFCTQMHGPVYKDSCVEFFVKESDADHYFNFEINCIGTVLAARRLSRQQKEYLPEEAMQQLKVRTSLPYGQPCEGSGEWSVEVEIPFTILGIEGVPHSLECNIYKCGDATPRPHYVSWSPIETPAPDFHRPEFFGELILE